MDVDARESLHLRTLSQFQRRNRVKPRSSDLRAAALRMWGTGSLVEDVCRTFGVSRATLFRWRSQWRTDSTLCCRKGGGRPLKLRNGDVSAILERLAQEPCVTLRELAASENLPVNPATLSRYMKRLGLRRKRVSDVAVGWPNSDTLRDIREFLGEVGTIPMENRVYMDESFAYTNEAPRCGWAPKGRRILRPRDNHGKRYMFAWAVRLDGEVHPPAISTSTMRDQVFMSYVRGNLVPNLRPGDVVIWDRLGKVCRPRWYPDLDAIDLSIIP